MSIPGRFVFISMLTCLVLILSLYPVHAVDIDWNKYCVDGIQLTRNGEMAFFGSDPCVDIAIKGRSAKDGPKLLTDGVAWQPGEDVEVTVDLRGQRAISGIIVTYSGKPAWQMATSRDGKNWWPIPSERLVNMETQAVAAANLARVARYIRIVDTGRTGVKIDRLYVYGEKTTDAGAVGGVYTSWTPPVAGQTVSLRAVIRNFGPRPVRNVQVDVDLISPGTAKIGGQTLDVLPAGTAVVVSIPWTPKATEPNKVEVGVRGEDWKPESRTEVIPVVNRKLYFPSWGYVDNDRLKYCNMNTCGEGFWSYLSRLHGRLALAPVSIPNTEGDAERDALIEGWMAALNRPESDGIDMDEWVTLADYPAATEALKRVCAQRNGKMVAPWLAFPINEASAKRFAPTDLVMHETYMNIIGGGPNGGVYTYHYNYRSEINQRIDACLRFGLSSYWILALSTFMDQVPSTPQEIEREVQYIRYHDPEMPGIVFYGLSYREIDALFNSYCYKYFIAPVITMQPDKTLGMVVRNIGGMNAHGVKVEAFTADGKRRLGSWALGSIPAGEKKALARTPPDTNAVFHVLPGKDYTPLGPPKILEVTPTSQVKGGPLQISIPEELADKVGPSDRVEFVNKATGKVDWRITKGDNWKEVRRDRVAYLDSLPTDQLDVGSYTVRLVDGTGAVTAFDSLSIVDSTGDFYVSKVNGRRWNGDRHSITIGPNDSFEVSWDFHGKQIADPAIYMNAPGGSITLRAEGRGIFARLSRLRWLIKDPGGEPVVKGSWTWKTDPQANDLWLNRTYGGWIDGTRDPMDARINMSANPGEWKLWISTTDRPGSWAVPMTPVISVNCVGRKQ